MTQQRSRTYWEKGIDNRKQRDRLPLGFVHDMVNMDPLLGGNLGIRTGYERVYEGTDVRGVLALNEHLLIADGTSLIHFNTETGLHSTIRTIAGAGPFCGDIHNNELFFCTATETLRFNGSVLREWGVPTQNVLPTTTTATGGILPAGTYRIAATLVNEYGEEGGTNAVTYVSVLENEQIAITLPAAPAGHTYNLYCSYTDSTELRFQTNGAGPFTITAIDDDGATLETLFLDRPPVASAVFSMNATLFLAVGNTVQRTEPFRPHLRAPISGFFQYPAPVDVLTGTATTLAVCADHTYLIIGADGSQPTQQTPFDFGGVAGTGVVAPDGRATWMTPYGQAILSGEGISLPNRETFTPLLADAGAAGIIEHNGNQLAVTTMRGVPRNNPLATSDFFEAEVINP